MANVTAWLGDLGRRAWGSLYWNTRKSVFRLRGASGQAPCQHPSDSGKAGETGCEACIGWQSPGRFRGMCPLLGTAADGRRVCTVSASQVRPFWGRALGFYSGGLVAAAAVAVLAAFAGFRAIGYRVPLAVVAWPPSWHRIHQARADYFYRQAIAAFQAGDVRQCYLALGQTYRLDPDNVQAALLLAQFMQIANPVASDAIYSRLLFTHASGNGPVAQAWFRALLARGDMVSLGHLSAHMLRIRAEPLAAWTEGALFAEKLDGNPAEIDALLDGKDPLSPEARLILSLARSLRTGSSEERAKRAERALRDANTAFERYYPLTRLNEFGRGSLVVEYVESPGGATLDSYDREMLKLDAFSSLDWRDLERKEIVLLLEGSNPQVAATLVSAHLIRHPDSAMAELVFAELDAHPFPPKAEASGAQISLLCMAGVNGLPTRVKRVAELLNRAMGGNFAALGRIQEFFGNASPGKNPGIFLPALPQVPDEVVYALTARYYVAPLQKGTPRKVSDNP